MDITFCHELPCFYALQETDHWTISAMNVPGYVVYGTDHGRTAMLCPREVNHFRRSWVDNERCTAILVGSTMLFSVFMPRSGRDEVEYIEALELVRATLTEGKRMGAVVFFSSAVEDWTVSNCMGCMDLNAKVVLRM